MFLVILHSHLYQTITNTDIATDTQDTKTDTGI